MRRRSSHSSSRSSRSSKNSSSRSRSRSRSRSQDSRRSGDEGPSRTIFVNGLEYEMRERDISEFFQKCGTIERINLPKYQDSHKNIGYCHVRFSTPEEADKALQLSGKYLGDRYVKIERAKDHREAEGGGRPGNPHDLTKSFQSPFRCQQLHSICEEPPLHHQREHGGRLLQPMRLDQECQTGLQQYS